MESTSCSYQQTNKDGLKLSTVHNKYLKPLLDQMWKLKRPEIKNACHMQNKLNFKCIHKSEGRHQTSKYGSKRVYIAVHMDTYATGQVNYEATLQVQARSRHELTLEWQFKYKMQQPDIYADLYIYIKYKVMKCTHEGMPVLKGIPSTCSNTKLNWSLKWVQMDQVGKVQ